MYLIDSTTSAQCIYIYTRNVVHLAIWFTVLCFGMNEKNKNKKDNIILYCVEPHKKCVSLGKKTTEALSINYLGRTRRMNTSPFFLGLCPKRFWIFIMCFYSYRLYARNTYIYFLFFFFFFLCTVTNQGERETFL